MKFSGILKVQTGHQIPARRPDPVIINNNNNNKKKEKKKRKENLLDFTVLVDH